MANRAQLDYIITNFTFFIQGFGKGGAGEKVHPPKIKKKTEAFQGGGMLAPRKVSLGYEAFELELELSSFDPQAIALISNKNIIFSINGSMVGDNGALHTAIYQMRGFFEELDPGQWEAAKKKILKIKAALDAVTLTIDGVDVFNIDIQNSAYSPGGASIVGAIEAALS